MMTYKVASDNKFAPLWDVENDPDYANAFGKLRSWQVSPFGRDSFAEVEIHIDGKLSDRFVFDEVDGATCSWIYAGARQLRKSLKGSKVRVVATMFYRDDYFVDRIRF